MLDLELTAPPAGGEKSAIVSPCGDYRYRLGRWWDGDKPGALFIMLNPSTADADVDDPTIRRCLAFARSWGCGSLTVVNLFAFRATDRKQMIAQARSAPEAAIGPDNDAHIRRAIEAHDGRADIIVAAWGSDAGRPQLRCRRDQVIRSLPLADLSCIGTTQSGEPRHPLYCRADLGPVCLEVDRLYSQGAIA